MLDGKGATQGGAHDGNGRVCIMVAFNEAADICIQQVIDTAIAAGDTEVEVEVPGANAQELMEAIRTRGWDGDIYAWYDQVARGDEETLKVVLKDAAARLDEKLPLEDRIDDLLDDDEDDE